jgi:hypothetical protein
MAREDWNPGGTISVRPGSDDTTRITVTRNGNVVDGEIALEIEKSETFFISNQDLKLLIVQALQPEGLRYE